MAVTINKKCTYTNSLSKDALPCSYIKRYVKTKYSRNEEKDTHVEHTEKAWKKTTTVISQHWCCYYFSCSFMININGNSRKGAETGLSFLGYKVRTTSQNTKMKYKHTYSGTGVTHTQAITIPTQTLKLSVWVSYLHFLSKQTKKTYALSLRLPPPTSTFPFIKLLISLKMF